MTLLETLKLGAWFAGAVAVVFCLIVAATKFVDWAFNINRLQQTRLGTVAPPLPTQPHDPVTFAEPCPTCDRHRVMVHVFTGAWVCCSCQSSGDHYAEDVEAIRRYMRGQNHSY